MKPLIQNELTEGRIACCECGASIAPNPANMCVGCVRSRVDITDGIPKQGQLYSCRNCDRFFTPPNTWTYAKLESKELLSVCLKRLKSTMTKVRLIDAAFVWTEPHSKRVKVKLTIQKEVFLGAILQQSFVVEFTLYNQMCEECRRVEAKDYWRACVQVRQRCDFKKTLFYLEQLLIKHNAQERASRIKPVPTGIDFYYAKQQDAKKLVEFISAVLPSRHHNSQQLVTHDIKNNFYDYKHTFCIDIVPITKDALVCLPKHVAQHCGNLSQFVVCIRVTNVITLIDPSTLQMSEITAVAYWKDPFEILMHPKSLVEFFVLEVDESLSGNLPSGHGQVSNRHRLVDVWVVRSHQVGQSDSQSICCRTHLGHLLNPGDTVLGYDILNSNINNATFDTVKAERVPDVVLVRKVFDRTRRAYKRQWKLKRLINQDEETASMANEYNEFLDDIEEDAYMRERINIYRKEHKPSISTTGGDEEVHPEAPTLAEMLEDLDINDVAMKDEPENEEQEQRK